MNVVARITKFNAGRDPERLQLKYQRMAEDAFAFLRGTCHLFYEDWSVDTPLNEALLAWICGDLHLENFGAFKGDNRLVYFDINDFDEAVLAPCTWELARLLISVLVAAKTLDVPRSAAVQLCQRFLDAYCQALQTGKARWVEHETAEGMIKDLLDSLQQRNRPEFLDKRTELEQGKGRFCYEGKHLFPLTVEQIKRNRLATPIAIAPN